MDLEDDEVAVGSYGSLRLIGFGLRTLGVALFAGAALTLAYGRSWSGPSHFVTAAASIGVFALGLIVIALGEVLSLMVDVAQNMATTAAASLKAARQLSRMLGEARDGERVEPRLF